MDELHNQAVEAQRKIAYMQEEKRLMLEAQQRTEKMAGEQKH